MAPSSPHAEHAAQYLIETLKQQGILVRSIDQAIREGHLTDLDWCETLDRFRQQADHDPGSFWDDRAAKRREYARTFRRKRKLRDRNAL